MAIDIRVVDTAARIAVIRLSAPERRHFASLGEEL
jgi:hypothetical protein